MTKLRVDPELYQFANPRQIEILQALEKYGGFRPAGRALKMDPSHLARTYKRVKKKALHRGYSPEHDLTHTTAPNAQWKFATTQYNGDGEIVNQWVRQNATQVRAIDLIREAMTDIVESVRGKVKPTKAPKVQDGKDRLAVFVWADAHIGLYSWWREAGEDFDLKIADREYKESAQSLIARAPSAEKALLIIPGDFLHTDGKLNTTSRGTDQDADTRFAKIVRTAISIVKYVMDLLLAKYPKVECWLKSGNHDENSGIMLSWTFAALYENEPRIEVSINPAPFEIKRFGKCLIGATHGHTIKFDRLPGLMATEHEEDWGITKHRGWYIGHSHEDKLISAPGCFIEVIGASCPRSAWEASMGYDKRAGRTLKCDIWHLEYGRETRIFQPVLFGRG